MLIQDLTQLRLELHQIPSQLGHPSWRKIGLRKSFLPPSPAILPVLKDYIIDIPIKVTNVPSRYQGMELSNGAIIISQNDYYVKNLPRTFSKDFLKKGIEFYWIDPVAEGDQIVSGIRCSLLDILDNRATTWELILRQLNDNNEPFNPTASPPIVITSDDQTPS